jgi:hypothetical protein
MAHLLTGKRVILDDDDGCWGIPIDTTPRRDRTWRSIRDQYWRLLLAPKNDDEP